MGCKLMTAMGWINTIVGASAETNPVRQKAMTKRIIFYILFFLCASTSTYIFHLNDDYISVTGLFPGLLFIATTIICSAFVTRLTLSPTLKFVGLTYLLYVVIFYMTLFSSYSVFFVGIITGGLGSFGYFAIYNDLIKKIKYNKKAVFALGTLAFLINTIILLTPIRKIDSTFFRNDLTGMFSIPFFIWQYIIGVALTNKIIADK